METPSGTRFLIVEQKGRDIWRGRSKSIAEAIERGEAGIGVDRELLRRAPQHNVSVVMVVVEEQRRIFLTPIDDFDDAELYRTKADYRGRAHRVLPYTRYTNKFLGPSLRKRKRTANKVEC
ncbi:hypothetical protein SAMN03159338_1569 [Sphingomonas sp. NFR04]|jgi:hypothetical protein|uniref:hypothetical protein n=1 Tax=Sphingomonas sp. NFR04 TaxID=1566283 RepID=UPI0008E4CD81|nr:hypothetical protein [Sphingomonas sp. NFR04]SFJ49719.1 hypothetical protein SAMN03159338_1569 [Sphingomonas sp. NFR04]